MYTLLFCLFFAGISVGKAFLSPWTSRGNIPSVSSFDNGNRCAVRSRRVMRSRSVMAISSPRRDSDEPMRPDEQSERALKNMLSDAAVASVVYYWLEFRDDLTPQWLKQFTRAQGDIADIGWQSHLRLLMREEPEEIVVRRMTQRPRGGSGNNPYLQPNRSAMEYTVLIEPQTIAKKIMQIREQISSEWITDLELVTAENFELERHHDDNMCRDKDSANRDRKMVFDHDPLNNTSSPYRGKNYKLLLDYVTKAAIRKYRSELRISGDRYTLNWLEKFVHKNEMEGGSNLKGNNLMEAILDGPIVVIKDPRTERNRVIDPGHIGRQIMMFRSAEADSVVQILETVADDHARLTRAFLEERMKDRLQDTVLTERRMRIVEASGPEDDGFPSPGSVQQPGGFEM